MIQTLFSTIFLIWSLLAKFCSHCPHNSNSRIIFHLLYSLWQRLPSCLWQEEETDAGHDEDTTKHQWWNAWVYGSTKINYERWHRTSNFTHKLQKIETKISERCIKFQKNKVMIKLYVFIPGWCREQFRNESVQHVVVSCKQWLCNHKNYWAWSRGCEVERYRNNSI